MPEILILTSVAKMRSTESNCLLDCLNQANCKNDSEKQVDLTRQTLVFKVTLYNFSCLTIYNYK